ncbi:LacI family DNA-binding transcriptional regulator [Pseudovibrio sp. SPO723]|uniref:LacI family DNA-binding transcriptional regulator n=1 Tax=Nesiotobacter zosterae TaxID=392721 RepID=UPI0029C5DFC8|nr:LacI family DNA-binding transcriptional regulator [Pseudovibrio sp. SPO723]MDX5595176.1 LacI family DNA-binding transcriptional regulator [Pseudovibrio sp. SPO723]
MATIAQVAVKAGVSTATVSRALNKPEMVDAKTKAKVQEAVQSLGYRPNQVAQGLASRSSRTIGVVVNQFGSAYYGTMIDGAERALRKIGYKLIAESSGEAAEGERSAWQSLFDRQCEAVIVHSDALAEEELTGFMEKHPMSVLMNRHLPDYEDRCVYLDNVRGGALAAAHLVAKGHRKIATITGPFSYHEARDRLKGFEQQLAEAGIPLDPDLTAEGNFKDDMAFERMMALLNGPKEFTALFCQSDEMAAGAIEACRQKGLRIPDDISIIGFDDVDLARHLSPKLTTVRQPLREIGAAAGLLAHAVARKSPDIEGICRSFEAEVIERASVLDLNTGS